MAADLYDVLGTPADASQDDLKRAYRRRVREYHPDVNDGPDADAQFKLVRKAHDVLSNPAERKDYDRLGHRTYADRNLPELPALSVFPGIDDGAGASRTGTGAGGSTSSSSGSKAGTGRGRRTKRSRSSGAASNDDASSGTRSNRTTRTTSGSTRRSATNTNSTNPGASAGSTSGATSGTTSAAGTASKGETTAAGASTSTGSAASAGGSSSPENAGSASTDSATATSTSTDPSNASATTTGATSTTGTTGGRRRGGLGRWYALVVVAGLAYVGALGAYAAPNLPAVGSLASALRRTPAATLTAALPLPSPAAFAWSPVVAGAPTAGAALLAGVVLLPVVVVATVARYGRGTAWLYALGSLAPALTLAAWPFVPTTTWLALCGLVLAPVLGVGGFLVDVGRYLLATRRGGGATSSGR